MNNSPPVYFAALSAILLVTCAFIMAVPQGLDTDIAWQVKAIQQSLGGESKNANSIVMPDPKDLSADVSSWISWWAPGPELFLWPLMALGLAPGSAVRVLASGCVIVGSVGWAIWISSFALPRWIKLILCFLVPWMHYVHNLLFSYIAEGLVFASVPWALLAGVWISESIESRAVDRNWLHITGILGVALAGLWLGFLYVLKYSAVFVSLGVLLFIAHESWNAWKTRSSSEHQRIVQLLGVLILTFAAPILGLSILNRMSGGAINVATETTRIHLHLSSILFAVANPALMMASAYAPLSYLLLHPRFGLFGGASLLPLGIAGAPGGLALLFLLFRYRPAGKQARLACAVFCVSVLLIIVVWTTTGVSYESRHLAGAGLAILPWATEIGFNIFEKASRVSVRFLLACLGICYILLPSVYGVAAAIGKMRRQSQQITGPNRAYNPFLAGRDLNLARGLLLKGFDPKKDVWYVTDPNSALELPGRALIIHADFIDAADLVKETYRTHKDLNVRLVLPRSFGENGKADIIKRSFTGADAWHPCPTDGITLCWTSLVRHQDYELDDSAPTSSFHP